MAKMCLKKQSKRVPARRRYKIEKRVRQHNKKKRREEKKSPKAKKANKMIVVPSVCPFKEEILKEAEEFKQREKEERKKAFERHLQRKKEQEEQEDAAMEEEEPASLDDLIKSAQSRQKQHEIWEEDQSVNVDTELTNRTENSLKAYYKEFRKVVEAADVVLEVVDARDPLGTRCLQVEEAVKEAKGNKKLVLVLNKADLVPKEILTKWLQYLRQTIPAIAFKASTQKQKQNLSRRKVKKNWSEKETNVSPCVGAEVLMSLLNNYCRNKDIKTSIHVGIVGLPNVGKSSIINSLKRSRACNVGSMPGITKSAQVVELDKKIKLLDSPGIVFAKTTNETDASTVLKNAVHVQTIADPITPATAILQRASKTQMMTLYNLSEYDTPQEFFISLAETTGKFKKGGIPDTTKAARQLLEDWNRGKIRYFTQPPEVKDESHISAAIVSETAAEFDLDSFKAIEAETLEKMDSIADSVKVEPVILEPSQPVVAAASLEEKMEDETAEENGELINENVTVVAAKKRKIDRGESKKTSGKEVKKEKTLMDLEGNQKLNLHKKLSFKKLKKMQARNSRHASSLAGVLENFTLASDDKYDFDTDFTS